uniref:Choline dehydrogenase n=1 Tax=Fulvimarina pelagi TaxID=217511 RepID=A0A0P0Z8Y3_9HYPH|nr:choline dehydrogenase [Fulvimarina pelagi]
MDFDIAVTPSYSLLEPAFPQPREGDLRALRNQWFLRNCVRDNDMIVRRCARKWDALSYRAQNGNETGDGSSLYMFKDKVNASGRWRLKAALILVRDRIARNIAT